MGPIYKCLLPRVQYFLKVNITLVKVCFFLFSFFFEDYFSLIEESHCSFYSVFRQSLSKLRFCNFVSGKPAALTGSCCILRTKEKKSSAMQWHLRIKDVASQRIHLTILSQHLIMTKVKFFLKKGRLKVKTKYF